MLPRTTGFQAAAVFFRPEISGSIPEVLAAADVNGLGPFWLGLQHVHLLRPCYTSMNRLCAVPQGTTIVNAVTTSPDQKGRMVHRAMPVSKRVNPSLNCECGWSPPITPSLPLGIKASLCLTGLNFYAASPFWVTADGVIDFTN